MAPVDATTATGDAAHENHPAPALLPHPKETGLGNDKLTAGVDLHYVVPVLLFNVLGVSNSPANAGIGDENRHGLVLGSNFGQLE